MGSRFENNVKLFFITLKKSKRPLILEVRNDKDEKIAFLELLTVDKKADKKLISAISRWRKKYSWYFPSQFRVTNKGTEAWFQKGLMEKEDRILFVIKNLRGKYIGHMGLYSFDFKNRTCEIDNVVRGDSEIPGLMTFALSRLINWTFENIAIKKLFLRVFSDNSRAIALYERLNFKKRELIPLFKRTEGDSVFWEEEGKSKQKPERYFQKMEWIKK